MINSPTLPRRVVAHLVNCSIPSCKSTRWAFFSASLRVPSFGSSISFYHGTPDPAPQHQDTVFGRCVAGEGISFVIPCPSRGNTAKRSLSANKAPARRSRLVLFTAGNL